MGEAITRLNPQVESAIQRIFLVQSINLIIRIIMILPLEIRIRQGPKPYDYRKVIGLCILRILLKKTYSDYEIEMREDPRICSAFGFKVLPSKSTIQRQMSSFSMDILRRLNQLLISDWIKRKLNISIDASGIRIIGRSIWYTIRINEEVSRRECDKIHLANCNDTMLILNWFITKDKKSDCPFFTKLLTPFKILGIVLADKGYLSRKNFQYVEDKCGSAFIPFKKNSTGKRLSSPAWKRAFGLWKTVRSLYKGIYHQRSRVECIFSVLKKKWGDSVNSKKAYHRRREMGLRFICYNIKLIICLEYAKKNGVSLWVRAKGK